MPDLDRIIEVGTASARVPDALDIRWTSLYAIPAYVQNDESLRAGFEYGGAAGGIAASFVILGARARDVAVIAPLAPPQGYPQEIGLFPFAMDIYPYVSDRWVEGTLRAGIRLQAFTQRDLYPRIKTRDGPKGSGLFAAPVRVESFSLAPSPAYPDGYHVQVAADALSVTFTDPGRAPAGIASPQQRFAIHLERELDWEADGIDNRNDADVDIRGFLGIDADINTDQIVYRKIWCRRIDQTASAGGPDETGRQAFTQATSYQCRAHDPPALGDVCRVAGKIGFVIEVEEIDRRTVEFVHEVTLLGALPEDIEDL